MILLICLVIYLIHKEINKMGKISLKKYGFVKSPEDNFSDDGNYFFVSWASFNNCDVRSTICYNDCGQNLVFRDFDIERVNGIIKSRLPENIRTLWRKLENEANLGEFNGCDKRKYTKEAVEELMKRIEEVTSILSGIVEASENSSC